jgi:DNA-nicking Smr family endonuclease
MGRKRRSGKYGAGKEKSMGSSFGSHANSPSVSKAAAISFEISAEADQAFLDAMEGLDPSKIPGKEEPSDADLMRSALSGGTRAKGKGNSPDYTVDLHGYTLSEANDIVGSKISEILVSKGGIVTLRIITGKGHHSGAGGSVLAKDVHAYVQARFRKSIERMDSAPADVIVGNLPIRGHFDVVLRCL